MNNIDFCYKQESFRRTGFDQRTAPSTQGLVERVFSNHLEIYYQLPQQESKIYCPKRLFSFITPGLYVFADGKNGFRISEKGSLTAAKIKENLSEINYVINNKEILFDSSQLEEIKKPVDDSNGIEIRMQGNTDSLAIGINPKKQNNLKIAMEYIQDLIYAGEFWQQTPHEMIEVLKNAHRLLLSEISIHYPPGDYRDHSPFMIFEEESFSLEARCQEAGLTPKETRLFKSICNGAKVTTDEQNRVLFKMKASMPPSGELIPSLMVKFMTDLKQRYGRIQEAKDYIELAAFFHNEFVDIHPFYDGNGRMARMVMNAILMEGGYPCVFFSSNQEYTNSFKEGVPFFAEYLKKRMSETIDYLNREGV